uniref:LanC-like protein 3 n=1 Tax=Ascaris suum TaxID=6253 RepID=F1LD19_ASCSU
MIVAYLYFRNEKFLQSARRALDLIWRKGVLHKGPGICHGVAGSGYAFLLYYRLTHEQVSLMPFGYVPLLGTHELCKLYLGRHSPHSNCRCSEGCVLACPPAAYLFTR